jgi:four helix bundle protein
MSIRNYQDLIAWQEAMNLVEAVHKTSKLFPREEQFCLIAQIRRAAISVPSNIAEGQGRRADKEFARFLHIAHGSLREVETQTLIAKRLGYVADPAVSQMMELSAQVGRLITGLINTLQKE